MAYAKNTSVSIDRTEVEIKKLLTKSGAKQVAIASDIELGMAIIIFSLNDRRIKFTMALPNGKNIAQKKWEQLCRSKWRALLLCIKAKIESYESGIETFEDAFLAHIVIGNETVSQKVLPEIATYYESGKLPPLLLS